MNKNIEEFYLDWSSQLNTYLRSYVYDEFGRKLKPRFAYLTLQKYLNNLLNNSLSEDEKIILLPGIRGVGKTTLLAQLYFFEHFKPKTHFYHHTLDYRFYISTDRLSMEGISLKEFTDYLEKNIWGNLVKNRYKLLFLIDEIQYDPKWGLFLKLLFDKTKGNKNILIIATGSSALLLNQDKELIRRSRIERLLPMKFTEYLMLYNNIFPLKNLSHQLKTAVFDQPDALSVFESLSALKPKVLRQLEKIKNLGMVKKNYFLYGSFPFSAKINNPFRALDLIKDVILTNIIQKDLILMEDFSGETLAKIVDLLYLLANSDNISIKNLSNTLNLHSFTVTKILRALAKAEIIYPILPYGRPYAQIKKSPKYLFLSPNIRSSLITRLSAPTKHGTLLEDYVSLFFVKELQNKAKIFYDYSQGGADFIIRFHDLQEIVIEVGFGKENLNQVITTLNKTSGRAKYGLVIGSRRLELKENVVKIPLNYFLLV